MLSGISCFCKAFLCPPAPRAAAVKRNTLFGALWKTLRIFSDLFFCGHFPWQLTTKICGKHSPKFRGILRQSLAKISNFARTSLWGLAGRRHFSGEIKTIASHDGCRSADVHLFLLSPPVSAVASMHVWRLHHRTCFEQGGSFCQNQI